MATAKNVVTRIIRASGLVAEEDIHAVLRPAIDCILAGKPIGMPTETVYGLAANALDPEAASQIFAIKGRPRDNPLIVHISSLSQLSLLTTLDLVEPKSPLEKRLQVVIESFWPGPLTLLLPKQPSLSDIVTCGLPTVAVRFPAHKIAQELIRGAGVPLAAPSANLSGRPSPTTAQHVMDDLSGQIEWIVDGGSCESGLESTVLDALSSKPMILRPGSITAGQLEPFLPEIQIYGADNRSLCIEERPPTPGLKYRHYSPTAPVILFGLHHDESTISDYISERLAEGLFIVRLVLDGSKHQSVHKNSPLFQQIILSKNGDASEIARNLFAALRDADRMSPAQIVSQEIPALREGLAVMNRLSKAASRFL